MESTNSSQCPECGVELESPDTECANCLLKLGFSTVIDEDADTDLGFAPEQKVFGDYELLDEIARGGMGVVYRARQKSLDRMVALKLILGGQLATKEFVRRFRTEASSAAALQHSHIVAIHDVGVHDGHHYLSMDYVEGQNLAQLVGNKPLAADVAARYMISIAEAIQHAHDQGILHRDLKPSNVLVDAGTDEPKVADFGLAKKINEESSLTLSGQILGSPHFMPPEQADHNRGKVSRASDVYGLGAILYYLLTARPPFQGDSLEATLRQVLNTEPVSPRLLDPSVPRDIETICLKCLNKEPNRRYATAREVGEDLKRFRDGDAILARPTTRLERTWRWCRRNRAVAALLTVATLLILTLAIGAPIAAFNIERNLRIANANLYGADMNTVQTALDKADLVLARELLDRHRPLADERDERGFEWAYLWTQSQGDEEHIFEPKVHWPRRVLFSPDGGMLAAGGRTNKTPISIVWSTSTKEVIKRLPAGERPVAFHPNKPELFTVGPDGLKIWNTTNWSNSTIGPCAGHSVAKLSPNLRWLVVYGDGLQVWDARNWTLVSSNRFANLRFWSASTLAVSRDSTRIVCGDGFPYASAARLHVFELPSLERVPWSDNLPPDISSTAYHPEQDVFLTGNWSGDIEVWNSKTGESIRSNMKQSARIMAITFNPADPNIFATTGGDRSVRLWNFETQEEVSRMHGAKEEVEELAFSPDGQTIATGGHGNPIALWNVSDAKSEYLSIPTKHLNCALDFSTDGKHVLTIDATGQLMYRDATTFDITKPLLQVDLNPSVLVPPYLHLRRIAMDISPDHSTFAIGTTNGVIEIWNLETQSSVTVQAHTKAIRELSFTPEGNQLLSIGQDTDVHLWDLATLQRKATAKLEEMPGPSWSAVAEYSPRGDVIAIGAQGHLSILDRNDLRRVRTKTNQNAFVALQYSPHGRYLAASQFGPTIKVWDTVNWGKEPVLLRGHQMIPYDITFSEDGRRMVTGSDKLVIWDTETWQQLARYEVPIMSVNAIWFSPDGNDLITSDDEAIRVWRATSFEEIARRETEFGRWP